MGAVNVFVITSGIFFLGFLLGGIDYTMNHEENRCEMTYMFEYPQYVRIMLPLSVAQSYPRYKLFAYGEGQYTEKLRGMQFRGIPVLFIPGNSGSHKQVRSLASVSLRMSSSSNSPYIFNYFTADLNEEYSAMYGAVLYEQTKFIHECVKKILSLYTNERKRPSSVIVIGHSMGGLVAKGLLLEPEFDPNLVNCIITLATPHKSPVLMADEHIAKYHTNVSRYWFINRNDSLKNIAVASIGGGQRDIIVRPDLIKSTTADFNVMTTSIPTVWLSTDHLCVLWCKQLVLVIVRALFDMVDPKTHQISTNIDFKKASLSYHLVKRTASKRLAASFHPKEAHFDEGGDWDEPLKRHFSFQREKVMKNTYLMIRLVDDPKYQMAAILAVNLDAKDWVYACIANKVHKGSRICDKGDNLSSESKFVPSLRMKRKTILLNLAALKKMSYTHVVVRIPPTADPVEVHVDVHSAASRKLVFPAPKFFFFASSMLLELSAESAIRYEIRLQGAEHIWQAYILNIRPICPLQTVHHATASVATSWSSEDAHAFVTSSLVQPLHVRLQSPKPSFSKKNESATIKLILDPSCRYAVTIQSSLRGILSQLVRFYSPMLLPYMVAVLLLAIREQLRIMQNEGYCCSINSALAVGAKPYYILPAVKIGSKLIGFIFNNHKEKFLFPPPDYMLLQEQDLDFFLLPIIAYTTAFAVVYLLGIVCFLLVMFWGNAFHKIVKRALARFFRGGNSLWSEWALMSFLNFPKIVSALLIAIAFGTCGAVALLIGLCFYFLFICKLYEDLLEEMLKYPLKVIQKIKHWATETRQPETPESDDSEVEDIFSRMYFHSTILLLWLVMTALHFPCALVWAQNVRNSAPLHPDPSLLPAIILCMCAGVLWQKTIPVMKMRNFMVLDYGIFLFACMCIVYASLTTYRASMFVHMTIVVTTVFQTMMTESPSNSSVSSDEIFDGEYENTDGDEDTSDEKSSDDSVGIVNEKLGVETVFHGETEVVKDAVSATDEVDESQGAKGEPEAK
ncbi:GPI inositol-deacylase [Ischnura elegans]|uniref:GPI inositol-deacylase n=1 Tax=Ischnura elegans TaxID=197161 RepID=UPI001ED89038|nr:GPI inositol-deacylase [Ischnura elegans]